MEDNKAKVNIKKQALYYSYFLAAFLCVTFLSVMLVIVVKNVFYEGLGMENAFIHSLLDGGTFDADDDAAVEVKTLHPNEEHVEIDWASLYPFTDREAYGWGREKGKLWSRLDQYLGNVHIFEEKLSIYTGELLAFQRPITIADSKLKDLLGWKLYDDVIPMKNGHLAAPYKRLEDEEMEEIIESVSDLNAFLDSYGVPLVYVNAGTKVDPKDKQMIDPDLENSNENADALLKGLKEHGVETLDFREEIEKSGVGYYDRYYRLDHHWSTDTQLWAAGVLAEKLNEHCGFNFDPAAFDPDNYEFERYGNAFLGSYGRIVVYQGLLDDFDRIKPKEPWDISVSIPSRNVLRRGDYEDVFIERALLDKVPSYNYNDHLGKPDAYNCTVLGNDAVTTTINNAPKDNRGRKLLLIHDSFDFYLSTYLAGDVERIDRIQLSGFKGSLREYMRQNPPDAVVIMYYGGNILPIDWRWHNSFFDFR